MSPLYYWRDSYAIGKYQQPRKSVYMYIVALYILYIGGKDNVYIFVQRIWVLNFII